MGKRELSGSLFFADFGKSDAKQARPCEGNHTFSHSQ